MSWLWHCMVSSVEWFIGFIMWGLAIIEIMGAWDKVNKLITYWRSPRGSSH